MIRKIPYGRQDLNESDIEAVVQTLRSEWLTQGPSIEKFERKVAEYCGTRYAVAVASATAGLHIACASLGLKEGGLLWTSPNTFVASANCALYCGAGVDFVDIDPRTYNMSISALRAKLQAARAAGRRLPDVLVPVHFSGQSAETDAISELAREYGFAVIEDAAHAIGGRFRDKPIGSCQFSEMAVFSFHPVKIVTTAEGGMVLTNRQDLYEKLIRLRTHGITRDPKHMQNESHGPWYYEQIELGFHYRMTDMQAALGTSQLSRLDEFVSRRHELAKRYDAGLEGLPLVRPWRSADCYSAFHLYVIRLKLGEIKKTRRQVYEELHERGIGVNVHYIPVHYQPYYQKMGFKKGDYPEAERYYEEAVTLPLYSALPEQDQDHVISVLRDVLK